MTETTLICYRGACSEAAHPLGYNRVTHGLYCIPCARRINRNDVPGGPLYPLLGLLHSARPRMSGGSLHAGIIVIREQG